MLKSSLDKKSFWLYIKNIILKCPEILLKKSLEPVDTMMKGSICEFNIFGEKLIISGEHFSGGREIYSEKVYFPEQDFNSISLHVSKPQAPQFKPAGWAFFRPMSITSGDCIMLSASTLKPDLPVFSPHLFISSIRSTISCLVMI